MYTKILEPEIMASMLPEGFPADKLSRPQYKMIVERDVMVVVRDGVHIAVDVFRPDAAGEFPSLFSASPYNKDLAYLPSVPTFHMRETNDFEYFVSRGYAYVHMDVRGTGKSVEGQWQLFSPDEQRDLHDVIEWIAAQPWCTGKVGHDRRVVSRHRTVVRRRSATAASCLHRALRRGLRPLPGERLPRRHAGGGFRGRLAHHGDPRPLPSGSQRRRPHVPETGTSPGI